MSKNVNFVGIKNLQKIIKDLGIKQGELSCKGAPNISQLLSGIKAITEDVSAPALVKKIYEIMNEKELTLPYEVTVDLLLGRINIITNDILKELESEVKNYKISNKTINDIDNNLKEIPRVDALTFLNDTIQLLSKDIYANAPLIKKYAQKLLNLDLEKDEKIRAYQQLIRAYRGMRKYEEITDIAELIEDDLKLFKDKDVKISCYGNIAAAYHKLDMMDESVCYFKKLKELGKCSEFFYLTLKSAGAMKKKNYKDAEKGYLTIISKATKQSNNDYIVDGYSNLADAYCEMNLKDQAKENIDTALTNITCGTSKEFRANTYFNAFNIYNKFFKDDFKKIEDFFNKALPIAKELNDLEKINSLVEPLFDRYFEMNKMDKVHEILTQLEGIDVKREILFKVIKILKK